MDVPMDYYVWGTMLRHYQRHMPKLANVMPRKKGRFVDNTEWSASQVHWQGNCIILQQTLIVCCCNWWALTLRSVCLNTEWTMGIWHSWLKHLNCWWKAVKNLICYSCIFHAQKFKLLYPRNYISYFNKMCRIFWVNNRIQSLKVWHKFVLPWLKYSIFARGLFFIGSPCILHCCGWEG